MKNTTTILKTAKKFVLKNIINLTSLIVALGISIPSVKTQGANPEVIFFDVGQGDAILIQQDNFQILVDGGPDDAIIYHLTRAMPTGDRNIEVLILTHPHEDHIGGLMNVLDEFTVERVFLNRIHYENRSYNYLLEEYKDIVRQVVKDDSVKYRDIQATVLYPPAEKSQQYKNINNESVVILVEIDNYKILLMGDIEVEVEKMLLEEKELENIYILKAGHHCSKTATSDMFLKTVKPEIAICSCGEGNKFGHPHYETIEKFKKANVQYFITYKEGSIFIKFDDL